VTAPPAHLKILTRIQAAWLRSLRGYAATVEIGPFVATFDPLNELTWINYAVPASKCDDAKLQGGIDLLRPEFATRKRRLRFEFHQDLWPQFAAILERNGLVCEARMPLMACERSDLHETSDRFENLKLEELSGDASDQQLREYVLLRDRGFGMETNGAKLAEEVEQSRARLRERKIKTVCATMNGAMVGAGSLMLGGGETPELVGVITAEPYRRRGIARTISQHLVREHLQSGGLAVWLTAADEIARRVYERIGFRVIGTQLNYIEPQAST
jgi:ribosomal protein S18 acetylase RimI-like enzyme